MFVVLIDARQTHSLCSLASCVLHTVHLIQQIFFYAVAQLHVAALHQHQPSRTGGKYVVTVVCFLLQCYVGDPVSSLIVHDTVCFLSFIHPAMHGRYLYQFEK